MGLFSSIFGGSKSNQGSTQQSTQTGFGLNQSFSDSLSTSASRGVSSSQGTSTQSIAFEELFRQLYGGAVGATERAVQMVPALEGQAARLFNSGAEFLESLGGGVGQDYLSSRITGANPLVDEQIAALGDDIGTFLREDINPALADTAIRAGQLGGSRQGVAQGRAATAAVQEFQRGALGIRTADMAARDQAADQLARLQQQGAATGLSALPGLLGIAQGASTAGLTPFSALAAILGGPTVLTQSQQTAESEQSAESIAQAIAQSLGLSYDYGQSTGSSWGSSKGTPGALASIGSFLGGIGSLI